MNWRWDMRGEHREQRWSGDLRHGLGRGEEGAGGVDEDGLMGDVAVDGPPVVVVLPRAHRLPPRAPRLRDLRRRRRPEHPPCPLAAAHDPRRRCHRGSRAQPRSRHCHRCGEVYGGSPVPGSGGGGAVAVPSARACLRSGVGGECWVVWRWDVAERAWGGL